MSWFSSLFLLFYFFYFTSQSLPSPLCHQHEISALIQFRNSFSIQKSSSGCHYQGSGISSPNSTVAWDTSIDCWKWSGVTCDRRTGFVVGLRLKCGGLWGIINSNSSLFALTRLQTLILSHNNFEGSEISPKFGTFQSMTHLDLSNSNFTGQVPVELAYLSNLVRLDLSYNYNLRVETSCLRQVSSNLTSVEDFVLNHVDMSHVLANDSFTNLSTSLRHLDLQHSGLSGEFPESIFKLQNLKEIRLGYNEHLIGSFPRYNCTTSLEILSLSYTKFLVDIPYLTQNLKHLNTLLVNGCKFVGPPLALVKSFPQITTLGVAYNNLGGQIPWNSLNLENSTYLDLAANNFSGQLPEICRNSESKDFLCDSSNGRLMGPIPRNLKSLLISHNLLGGVIPSWIYNCLPYLEELSLGHNNLTGQINEFQFKSLTVLQLSSNMLVGPVPRSVFQQENLYFLDLASNDLSGVVTFEELSNLKSLQHVSLSFNRLSMVSIKNNPNTTLANSLWILRLSSCNISEFPYSLRGAELLGSLELSNNRITGSIPEWLEIVGKDTLFHLNVSNNLLAHIDKISWKNLQLLDLRGNQLQGQLPIPPFSTILYSVSNNKLDGEIPSSICGLGSIQVLDLSNNKLSGNIPPCIGNFSRVLRVLDLRKNMFCGTIPPIFSNSLMTLNLRENQLEGPLPQSLRECKSLEFLDLGNNMLSGSFPRQLESLMELKVLILGSNRFYGPISSNDPKVRLPFQKLRIIDLSNNEFEGLLPKKYFENFAGMKKPNKSSLQYMETHVLGGYYYRDSTVVMTKGFYIELPKIQTKLITIDFSKNSFTGKIPNLVGNLNLLKGLYFSHNKLTGVIPTSFGNLKNLESLDLSSNALVGRIPPQLASLNQLAVLNLSRNNLEGPIPRGSQFNTFKEDAFSENPQLCGFPLSKPCVENVLPEEEEHGNFLVSLQMVMAGYGCGLAIGISMGYIVFFSERFDYWLKELVHNRRAMESLIFWH